MIDLLSIKYVMERQQNILLVVNIYLFADPEFCCNLTSPEMAVNATILGLPGRTHNRGSLKIFKDFQCLFVFLFLSFIKISSFFLE
jgi:hypothetical protein